MQLYVEVRVDEDGDGPFLFFCWSIDLQQVLWWCRKSRFGDKNASASAAPRPHYHSSSCFPVLHTHLAQLLPHPPLVLPLTVTAASHKQHGSEVSANADSDQNDCDLYIMLFSYLQYMWVWTTMSRNGFDQLTDEQYWYDSMDVSWISLTL